MTAVALPFERAEYDARIAKARRAMTERGIDLLVVTDPSNMAWLTGYDGWSFYVHQCVLLGMEGEPVWYGRGQDANGARRTVFMGDDHIIGYPDHYVQSSERHPMDYLACLGVRSGRASASRWTIIISAPPALPRSAATCRRRRSGTPPGWSTGSAR